MSCGKGTGGGFDSSDSFPLWTTTTNAYAAHMVEQLKASGRESGNHPGATSGSEDLQGQPISQRSHDVPGAFSGWAGHHADFGGGAEEKRAEAGGIVALADSRLSVLFSWDPNWVL